MPPHAHPLTPGHLDGYAVRAFAHGACHLLAVALHDATGWPLMTIIEADTVYEGATGGAGMHYVVQHPSGRLVDVDGAHDAETLTRRFDDMGAEAGPAALATTGRTDAVEWYAASGGTVALALAASFVAPLLERVARQLEADARGAREDDQG